MRGADADLADVRYEYDFVSWNAAGRRALDSAFRVHYDAPIHGYPDWRQRNLTVVGAGQSVCVVVANAPLPLWKKSPPLRQTLDRVLATIELN